MSNKEVLKKIETRDGHTRSKSKASSSNQINYDSKKLELERKALRLANHRGEGDSRLQMSQTSLSSRSQSQKKNATEAPKSLQRKINKPNNNSLTPKTISKSSSPNVHSAGKATSSKTKSDEAKKSSSTEKLKSRENQKGYSEKRGSSTIFMPKSYSSRLNSKSADKPTTSTRDKEKSMPPKKNGESVSTVEARQRRNSRTLSPSEVKVLHSAMNRVPLQQTIQSNKMRPENSAKEEDNSDNNDSEYNYEDDFEDYESDFQECTDSEVSQVSEEEYEAKTTQLEPIELQPRGEQKTPSTTESQKPEEDLMHDSGHYELAEARKRAARIEVMNASPILPQLREPVNKSYSEERPSENKSLPSSTDEGFEDSRSGDFTKSPPLSQISFIDFRKSKEETSVKKPQKSRCRKRGEELLEMIKLDSMEWSLLECTPVPYEEFIRSYGKLNAQQTSTQTNEDNLDVEIQTNEILCGNKWTQFPIACRQNLNNKRDVDLFRIEQTGVGNDDDSDFLNIAQSPTYDVLQLNDFLTRAGSVILSLLEERKCGGNVFSSNPDELPFSEGCVKLSIDSVTFLAGRSVTMIHYSEVLNKVLLTIHSPIEEEIETSSKQDYITDCCIGCVWNISEPSMPTKLFYSPCPITASCFHSTSYNVVLAGLEDGSVTLWDLKEDEMWHQKVIDKENNLNLVIRSPTYTTAGNVEEQGHNSKIVAIRIVSQVETSLLRNNNKFVSIQICTLDEEGCLIIWSTLPNMNVNTDDLGLSQWGEMRLTKNEVINLKPKNGVNETNIDLFIDMHIDNTDNNNMYIATNTSSILHATCIGNKTNPSLYKKSEIDPCGITTCIERCPFKRSCFLVGCDDGVIRLHTLSIERPIAQLKDDKNRIKIKILQWSKSKPFTIYALDDNSWIHTWDLSYSDVFPASSVSLKKLGRVSSMELSPCRTEHDLTNQYLALGTETGVVEVHKLNKDFHYSTMEDVSREIDTFMRYVEIL